MTARDERSALTTPPTLYARALRLSSESTDALPPQGGHTLPPASAPASAPGPTPATSGARIPWDEARRALGEALTPLPADPATLLRRFARLGLRDRHHRLVRYAVADLPLPAGERAAARTLARQLTRSGTTVLTVTVGLTLLERLGGPEDVPHVFALGLLRPLTGPAVAALDVLDRRSAAVLWLVLHARREEFGPFLRALWAKDRQAVSRELLACPTTPRSVGSGTARRIADAAPLADLLADRPTDPDLLARAALLLVRMGCTRYDATELASYPEATWVYEAVVTRADLFPPTLENAALLLSLAQDLSSGGPVLLDWPPGRREALLE
ncbi:hypothetical protein [Streptomyces sp. NPDC093225]|uniref:hypothetical protein n=1 Tax=Streptomyces sp. NPDC093225 TaxID=3366034 RepID=UPI00380E7033